jgi:phosphoribosylanthranilate isomerase
LSGGIGVKDIEKIKTFTHPFFYAIDVNSKVEVQDGIKDLTAIGELVNELVIK